MANVTANTTEAEAKDLQNVTTDVTEKIKTVASDLVESVGSYSTEAKDQLQAAFEEVPALIKKYPLQSLAIGFGIGFLASMALTRSK